MGKSIKPAEVNQSKKNSSKSAANDDKSFNQSSVSFSSKNGLFPLNKSIKASNNKFAPMVIPNMSKISPQVSNTQHFKSNKLTGSSDSNKPTQNGSESNLTPSKIDVKQLLTNNKQISKSKKNHNQTSIVEQARKSSESSADKKAFSSKTGQSSDLKWLKELSSINFVECFSGETSWYAKYPTITTEENNIHYRLTDPMKIQDIKSTIESCIRNHIKSKNITNKMSSDQKWMNDVIKSGTLSDRVAALALKIQGSPIFEIDTLDLLISYCHKKEQRPAQLALEAVKDLMVHNLLPDRHLIPFEEQPILHKNMTAATAIIYWYEDFLKLKIKSIIQALEVGLKSTVDHFKKSSILLVKDLLVSKPEQEGKLLQMIVNKFGDPSSKISNYTSEMLDTIIKSHPVMRSVIIREIRQFISLPNLSLRIIYVSVLYLARIPLKIGSGTASVASAHEIAVQLVDTYVCLFEKVVKQDDFKSKLLSALLIGINRSYRYLQDKKAIVKHIDALFRLVHDESFSTATQALVLISYIALDDKENPEEKTSKSLDSGIRNRFYRALYSALSSDQILWKSHNNVFLNLLFRSIKKDPIVERAGAFLKRIFICVAQSYAPVCSGLLLLISEVLKSKAALKEFVFQSKSSFVNQTDDSSKGLDSEESNVHKLGTFDASKRDPSYALSGPIELWESSLLSHHFHPSVQTFINSLISKEQNHTIQYNSDPTVDLSTIAFLNRFAYKNPKKRSDLSNMDTQQLRDKASLSLSIDDMPLNSSEFIELVNERVDPDKQFFHKFFFDRQKLQDLGKIKKVERKKRDDDSDLDSDADISDNDGGDKDSSKLEKEIDDYADMLADQLMKNVDADADIDDDSDFSNDESVTDSNLVDEADDVETDDEFIEMEGMKDDDSSVGGEYLDEFEEGTPSQNGDGSDDDYEIMEFGDFDDLKTSNDDQSKVNKKVSSKSKRDSSKKRKSTSEASDFADASDYENEMEDILRQIRENQDDDDAKDRNTPRKKAKAK